jgi:hypothetical protein
LGRKDTMAYVNIRERRLPFVVRYIGDLYLYRHLAWNLVASDLRARFRRSQLGIVQRANIVYRKLQ